MHCLDMCKEFCQETLETHVSQSFHLFSLEDHEGVQHLSRCRDCKCTCCPLRVTRRFAHVHSPPPDELKCRFLIERKWNGSLIHVQDIILMEAWIGNLGMGDHDEITGFTFHFGRCVLRYMCTHPVHQSVNLDETPHDIILCRTTLLTEITTDLGGFQQNNGVCNSHACFMQLIQCISEYMFDCWISTF